MNSSLESIAANFVSILMLRIGGAVGDVVMSARGLDACLLPLLDGM